MYYDCNEMSAKSFKYYCFHLLDINVDSSPNIIYLSYVFNLEFTNGLLKNIFIHNYSCYAE